MIHIWSHIVALYFVCRTACLQKIIGIRYYVVNFNLKALLYFDNVLSAHNTRLQGQVPVSSVFKDYPTCLWPKIAQPLVSASESYKIFE